MRSPATATRLILPAGLLLMALGTQAAGKPPAPPVPAAPPLSGTPAGAALLQALEKAGHRFTPEVKTAWLAWSKAGALAELAATHQSLPAEFLAWVDSDPVTAATVYGQADRAAQHLVLLRSLELDLGAEEVRKKHPQWVLAVMEKHAAQVDRATFSNPAIGISLKERGLLEIKIPPSPCVRVDTRAKDRPLDVNDHIINFLAENPVVTEAQPAKEVKGKQVAAIAKSSRPVFAYEVMSQPKLQEAFNAHMKAHGQTVSIDCGDSISPWSPKKGQILQAAALFLKAYQEKGLFPKGPDARPTPGEIAAYVIRNDNFRFPEGTKRGWPRFNLNAPWPVLDYLAGDGMPLREREFIWTRFRDHGQAVGYGAYVGQIAQYPPFLRARRLQPSEFYYDTYPVRLMTGGVCGTMSNIGRGMNIGLGVPAGQASQPGHSCLVAVGGNDSRGYSLGIGQAVSGPGSTLVSGRGKYSDVAMTFYPVNYGLQAHLDSQIALRLNALLPADTAHEKRLILLQSGLAVNPYHRGLAEAIQNLTADAPGQVAFMQSITQTLAAVDKPGCPKTGYYNDALRANFERRLLALPVPAKREEAQRVADFLGNQGSPLWLKYQLAMTGLEPLKTKLTGELAAAVAGARTPAACALLQSRLAAFAAPLPAKDRKAFAQQLLAIVTSHETYAPPQGKAKRAPAPVEDPCATLAYTLAGQKSPAQLAAAEAQLKAAEAKRKAAEAKAAETKTK